MTQSANGEGCALMTPSHLRQLTNSLRQLRKSIGHPAMHSCLQIISVAPEGKSLGLC